MRTNDLELTVIVRGRPITEYPHHDKTFIEGRAGSEFEIEVRNHGFFRIEAVIAVDGLSVIDGKPAGSTSRGYLIKGRDAVRIPGWTLDTSQVAKFAFARKPDSYATQMTGSDGNNGVIGVMAFREKASYWPHYGTINGISLNSIPTTHDTFYRGAPTAAASSMPAAGSSYTAMNCDVSATAVTPNLGTAFGEPASFAVTTVPFVRDASIGTLVLYYDDRRGLKARGIRIERQRKPITSEPQAFPADYCTPPPGWNG